MSDLKEAVKEAKERLLERWIMEPHMHTGPDDDVTIGDIRAAHDRILATLERRRKEIFGAG